MGRSGERDGEIWRDGERCSEVVRDLEIWRDLEMVRDLEMSRVGKRWGENGRGIERDGERD